MREISEATALIEHHKYKEVIALLEPSLCFNIDNLEFIGKLAHAYCLNADFSKAIELNLSDYEGYFNRGLLYYAKKDYDKAIADWSKAIELEPKCPWPYEYRSFAYRDKGDYDKAWADVNKCQMLGGTVDSDVLDKLRKASGRSD